MNTPKDIYKKRNKILKKGGFMTYKEFLNSKHWRELKDTVRAKYTDVRCAFCNKRNNIHLHHTKYKNKNLLKKRVAGLLPLCGTCHQGVHDIERQYNIDVFRATRVFQIIYYPKAAPYTWKHTPEQKKEKKRQKFSKRANSTRIIESSGLPAVLHHSIHAVFEAKRKRVGDHIDPKEFKQEYIDKKIRSSDQLIVDLFYKHENKVEDLINNLCYKKAREIFS